MRLLLLPVLLLPIRLSGQDAEAAPPPRHVVQTALDWMKSSDPARRQAAYRSVHLLGKEAMPAFQKALNAALRHHDKQLADILEDRDNPYRELGGLVDELKSERERVNKLIHTDWKKDPEKIRMLRNELESVTRLYDRAVDCTRAPTEDIDRRVDVIATALVEIHREIALFNADDHVAAETPLEELKRLALKESFDGEIYLTNRTRFAAMRNEVERLRKADIHNATCAWANAPQVGFANNLNRNRAVVGKKPFRLDEQLSAAATGHSRDMRSHGFFSHTSPVKGKRTPGDRARKAGFKGGWSGENIFAGSAAHTAAYNAWFASDGHRFIMFANSPNVLGIGPAGHHWTLMTGRR